MKPKYRFLKTFANPSTLSAILVMSFAAIAPSITMGADIQWDGSDSTDWFTGTNWVGNAVPAAADKAFINNITVNTPAVTADTTVSELLIGFGGATGAVDLTAGTLTVNAWTVVGNGSGGLGTLNLTGSGSLNKTAVNASSNFYVGENAGSTGIVNINTTGSFTSAREVVIGYNSGTGTLNLSAGTMTVNNTFRVGSSGTGSNGTVNYTGGSLALNGAVRIGATTNAVTDFNIGAGAVADVSAAGTVRIGEGAGSNNTLDIDGTLNMLSTSGEGSIRIGHNTNTTTATNIVNVNTGGVLYSEGDMIHGFSGNTGSTNTLNINGGTVRVASSSERWMKIGHWDGQSSVINITNGGALKLNTNTDIKMGFNGNVSGSHTINVDGGSLIGYVNDGSSIGSSTVNAVSTIDMSYVASTMSAALNIKNGGLVEVRAIYANNNTTSATVNFDGGTLKATGDDLNLINLAGGGTRAVNILAGGATIDSNGYNVRIVNALQSSGSDGGLTKQGAGNLTLPTAPTFVGPTLISGGTLTLNGGSGLNFSTSSGVTINGSGAKLVLGGGGQISTPVTLTQGSLDADGTIDTLTVANNVNNTLSTGNGGNAPLDSTTLTFQGAATLNAQATGLNMDRYFDTVDLNTSAAVDKIVVNATNTSGAWTNGIYPVIYYSGTFTGDVSHFEVGNISGLNANQTAQIIDDGGAIAIEITGESLVWTGAVSGDWNTTDNNWSFESNPISFSSNDPVLFDDTASNFNVTITEIGGVSPGAIVFDNTGLNDYTISGSVGILTGSIVKNGDAKVTINTNNSYTGTTNINAGILEVGGTGSIASSSSINFGSNSGALLLLNLTGSDTYANPITGDGDVAKQGAGTLTLSGASTFTGDFTLDAGQLNINSAGALGGGAGTITLNSATLDNTSGGTINLAPNKVVTLNSNITFLGSNDLYLSNGAVTLTASRTVNVQDKLFGMGAPVDGANTYDLVKTGPGTLVFNGGDIGGNLDIQNGIVGINQDFSAAAPVGTGILQNAGNVGSKNTLWYGPADVSSNVLIRNNDGSNTRQLGIVKRGSGTLTLTNNANVATANLSVDSGRLVLNNTGTYGAQNDDGSTNTGLTAMVGNAAAANGVLEINGATVNYNNRSTAAAEAYRSTLNVGNNGAGAGAVKLTSGSLSLNRQLALGVTGSAFGGMTQTGGTASVGGFIALGLGTSTGVLNLNGGTFTQAGPVTNAAGGGSTGLINIRGNAAYNQTSTGDLGLWVGENGAGFLNVSDTATLTIDPGNNGLQLGRNASGVGTANLLGGTVTAKAVTKGAGAGTLNFNGGTLAANAANTAFLTGLTNAYVRAGGGTINNGGNAITIGQALLAPAGNGVSAAGLSVSGGGYIDTPIVTITGDGTGATAVANIDATGNLTGITMTNPGTGYTTPPTFALVGGGIGNTGAITGTATLVANTSGGMTFTGANITTLTGVSTYTGNTTVNSGATLAFADNAGLKFAPGANGVSNKLTGAGTVTLDGDFTIDTTGAAIANGNSWTLVDVGTLAESYGANFTVAGFTESADVWTMVDGNNTWTFSETTGVLTLSVTAGSGFENWITGFGLAVADQDPTDDPDADGLENMLEYILGGDPSVSDSSIVPTGAKSGSNFVLTFNRSDLSENDVVASVEYGNDLVGWTTVAAPAANAVVGAVTFTVVENGSDPDTVTATIPTSGAVKFFARVKGVK